MDIPPPSPTAPASLHSSPPALSTTTGASSAPPDWYHDLSQHMIRLILTCELSLMSKITNLERLITDLDSLIIILERLIIVLGSFSPCKLRFLSS